MSIKALYIHVPFCMHICAYCDFMRVGYHPKLVQDYLKALAIEKESYTFDELDTLYFGGGTPSSLSLDELKILLNLFKKEIKQAKEVSFEMNPESVDLDKVQLLKDMGINRISLGVQSFHAFDLKNMDRIHQVKDIYQAIETLKTFHFDQISIDLMYGLPHQSLETLTQNLDQLFSLDLDHFSIYALTIEEHSKWGREKLMKMDEDLEADCYEMIVQKAKDAGYRHYEISNFTKTKPSFHNLHYWAYDDYCGLGPGAHGKIGKQRLENTRNLQAYLQNPLNHEIISLSDEEEAFERIMMGLRVDTGMDIKVFETKTGFDFKTKYRDACLKHAAVLIFKNNHVFVNEKCRELLHEILVDFM